MQRHKRSTGLSVRARAAMIRIGALGGIGCLCGIGLVLVMLTLAPPSRAQVQGGALDIDLDGVADSLVLAPVLDPAATEPGVARVLSGATGEVIWEVASEQLGDYFAFAGEIVGDVDGDGVPDVAVTAFRDGAATNRRGRLFLYSGASGEAMAEVIGATDEVFGARVLSAGDLDGDGHADIAVFGLVSQFDGELIVPRRTIVSGRTFRPLATREMHERAVLMSSGRAKSARADMNADRFVSVDDLPGILSRMGGHPGEYGRGDLDADGLVTESDLQIFVGQLEAESSGADTVSLEFGLVSAMLGGPGFDCIEETCCDSNLNGDASDDCGLGDDGGSGGGGGGGGGGSNCANESVVFLDSTTPPHALFGSTYQISAIAAVSGGEFTWSVLDGAEHITTSQVVSEGADTSDFSFTTVANSGQGDGLLTIEVMYTNGECIRSSSVTIPLGAAFLDVEIEGIEHNTDTGSDAVPYGQTLRITAISDPPGGQFTWLVSQAPTDETLPPDTVIVEYDPPGNSATLELHALATPGEILVDLSYTAPDGSTLNRVVQTSVELFQFLDADGDGLDNLREEQAGTDPLNPDTDGDGLSDSCEVNFHWDALDPEEPSDPSAGIDSDFDGLSNNYEFCIGTDLFDWDSDDDGLADGYEIEWNLPPLDGDFNSNGIPDGQEDSDGDGLTNTEEQDYGTNPLNPDSDGDGVEDGDEIVQGSVPTDPTDLGNPLPEDESVQITVGLGDTSGSESEQWRLRLGDYISITSGGGQYITRSYTIRRGITYPITIEWLGSSLTTPDYDWQSDVRLAPAEFNEIVLVDPDGIITGGELAYGNDVNQVAGKTAYLYTPVIDLDIDSDNTRLYDGPDGSDAEDHMEDTLGGKILIVNRGDGDRDDIPAFADGMGTFGLNSFDDHSTIPLVPIHLDLRGFGNLENLSVAFQYSDSDPAAVTRTVVPVPEAESEFSRFAIAPGHLRLWMQDNGSFRVLSDFVPSGQVIQVADLSENPVLYIEAVAGSPTAIPIEVTVTTEDGKSFKDRVRVIPFDSETGLSETEVPGFNILYGGGVGTPGNDLIFGTPSDDVIDAGEGDDIIIAGGNETQDVIIAGAGSDVVYAWDGHNDIELGISVDSSVARENATRGRDIVLSERQAPFAIDAVLSTYRFLHGDNDPYLEVFLNDLNGVIRAVEDAGFRQGESDWDKIVSWEGGVRTTKYEIQLEFSLGSAYHAATHLRQQLLDLSGAPGPSNIFQGAIIGEALELALLQDDFEEHAATFADVREAGVRNAAASSAALANLYISGLSISNDGADLVIAIGDVADGNYGSALAILPFISRPMLQGTKVILRAADGSVPHKKIGDVAFGEYSGLGYVVRPNMERRLGPHLRGRRTLVLGTAQVTSNPGHASKIEEIAAEMAGSGVYEHITLNRSWRTATGRVNVSNNRPDVIGVRFDGIVDVIEVRSPSDPSPATILAKIENDLHNGFVTGQDWRAGNAIVVEIDPE